MVERESEVHLRVVWKERSFRRMEEEIRWKAPWGRFEKLCAGRHSLYARNLLSLTPTNSAIAVETFSCSNEREGARG